jgi:hypothetical protein
VTSDEFRKRIQRERAIRSQRDAAERAVPGERLRREIREAFERQDARDRTDDRPARRPPDSGRRRKP